MDYLIDFWIVTGHWSNDLVKRPCQKTQVGVIRTMTTKSRLESGDLIWFATPNCLSLPNNESFDKKLNTQFFSSWRTKFSCCQCLAVLLSMYFVICHCKSRLKYLHILSCQENNILLISYLVPKLNHGETLDGKVIGIRISPC